MVELYFWLGEDAELESLSKEEFEKMEKDTSELQRLWAEHGLYNNNEGTRD